MSNKTLEIENLYNQLEVLRRQLTTIEDVFTENNDSFFLLSMSVVIFLMQAGFAFLEAGISAFCYWAVGWAFAFGHSDNSLFGYSEFFLVGNVNFSLWFFQFVFAAAASSIVSGAVAERCEFVAYFVYCAVITAIMYPMVTHWAWHEAGWLKRGFDTDNYGHISYIDFAGSGVVHLFGGSVAFIGALILGARIGRFANGNRGKSPEMQGHSVPFAVLGGFLLMFGFFAFNGGSQARITTKGDGQIVGLAMTNTMICGASAALTALIIVKLITTKKWSLLMAINACLTGMVSSCAGCNVMEPCISPVVGVGAGLVYISIANLVETVEIDDPLDAVAVHAGGGSWGLFVTPLLMNEGLRVQIINGTGIGRGLLLLMWNITGAVVIISWSVTVMGAIFLLLQWANLFRVSEEVEIKGLDIYKHGEPAYPLLAYGHGWEEIPEETEHMKPRRSTIVENPEISLEELAQTYYTNTKVNNSATYNNRTFYETPEVHAMANKRMNGDKNRFCKVAEGTGALNISVQ